MVLISIIMPVWKPKIEQFKLSLESLLKQTHTDFEVVLVYTNFSKKIDDEVKKFLDENADDHRIKFFQNQGKFIDCLNFGIKVSKGELVARMDSDDVCVYTRFEEQINFLKDSKASLVGSWAFSISDDGKVIGVIEPPHKPEEIRKKIMLHNPILHPTILMQREMLKNIGYYDPNYPGAEDYELYLRALSNNYKLANVPKHLLYLRETSSSIMRGDKWKLARKSYIKAKNTALLHYGFTTYYDIFWCMLTPVTFFISPQMSYKIKNRISWNRKF